MWLTRFKSSRAHHVFIGYLKYKRRRSKSNGAFTDYQPQYPDFQGYFGIVLI